MKHVVVVGAGISGLTAAYWLTQAQETQKLKVTVLDSAPRAGGKIWSHQGLQGEIIDHSANGWLSGEPAVDRLLQALSLSDDIITASPATKTRWIFHQEALHPAPLTPKRLLTTRLLTPWAKIRLLFEPLQRFKPRVNDSLAKVIAKRLGSGVLDTLLAPMTCGVHGADPEALSFAAAFPRVAQALAQHGSFFRALRYQQQNASGQKPHLTSLKGGTGTLTRALLQQLNAKVQAKQNIVSVKAAGTKWILDTPEKSFQADALVLACPAPAQANLLHQCSPKIGALLSQIPHSPVAVVANTWRSNTWQQKPEGFGVLAARGNQLHGALGMLFTSNIFPGHTPEGWFQTRTILGGTRHPEAMKESDDVLIERSIQAHLRLFGPGQPKESMLLRHVQGIPRYAPGHLQIVADIKEEQNHHSGLFLCGNHIGGVSLKDSIRFAEQTAHSITSWLG